MLSHSILIFHLMLVFSASSETEFGNPENFYSGISPKTLKRSKRVVGGFPIEIEKLPYIVNIRRDGVFECGGSLITPNCVLTAAHCVKTGRAENFTIRGGNTFLDEKGNVRRVKQIFMHELYGNKTLDHDIAIFELQTPFGTKPKWPRPRSRRNEQVFGTIKYARDWTEMPKAGDAVRVAGWGLISETAKRPSNQLRAVEVDVMSQTECQRLYRSYRNVTSNMFCASVPGSKDACSADSGGPALFKGKLVGIVSWGKGYECARVNSPGVYVNVAALSSWIDDALKKSGCRY